MGKYVNEEGFLVYSGFWWKLALPEVILLVYLGVIGVTCIWATSRPTGGWTEVFVGVLFGLSVWTLFEYVLHRWLLHHTRYPLLRKIFWNGLHKEHHMYRQMKDPEHHGIHLAISLPIVLLLISSAGVVTESGWGLATAAGWILGYWLYEAIHWLFHAGDPQGNFGRFQPIHGLWAAHTVHHLHRADKNYGFVTLFWDRCFGTYLPIERARARRIDGSAEGPPA
ncbi:MAG: sterol desaturase family protein [Candidatus Methylomirabilales bacterium]